ncbi:patatin-like phospholipase family protein [Chondromyces apiculatus]|uniref:patatin-like phospholipase family protein n=1 Tax=Chondromyces apiculatus TaxID=51 RepID=UPI0007C4D3C2|nr:patatin-like phospholipase family protein [Chondromyces apiculatus]
MRQGRTALVLAGGAARGAYEAGVVQHLVEEVARDLDHVVRFDVLCGTSVGALNACGLAAFADLGQGGARRLIEVWTRLQVSELVRPDARGILEMGTRLLGRPSTTRVPAREGGLIDPEGLERLVAHSIPFARIEDNLRAGYVDALTVSTTHVASGRTVVYVDTHEGEIPSWGNDPTTIARAARIGAQHALASAAIPILFRAVKLDGDYHCDGGLRQNVPLSPARRLGASHVLVVNPRHLETTPLDDGAAEDIFPGPLFLLGKTLNALLLDRIDTDLARLSSINRILEAGTRVAGPGFVEALNREMGFPEGVGLRTMKAMLVRASDDIGQLAVNFVRSPAFSRASGMGVKLLRRLAERDSRSEADLLSYLLFDGGFAGQLIEMGRADARARHEELCRFFAEAARSALEQEALRRDAEVVRSAVPREPGGDLEPLAAG